jgi:two-component system chemotaxis response regulator CheY
LRGHTGLAQQPAVMISTEAELSDRTKAYEAGANFYMIKPTRPEILIGHVQLLMGEQRP